MRLLIVLALVGCTPAPKPMPDADPFGVACPAPPPLPISTCVADDGEIGWCIDYVCRRNCINGACSKGGEPTPVYGDCYCK